MVIATNFLTNQNRKSRKVRLLLISRSSQIRANMYNNAARKTTIVVSKLQMQTEKKRHLHKQQLIVYNEPELHIKMKNQTELLTRANKRTNCLARGKRLFGLAVSV